MKKDERGEREREEEEEKKKRSGRWGYGIFSLLIPILSGNILPTSIIS